MKRLLELSIQECGQIITQFFKGNNDDVRNILSKGENDVAANVLQLLLAHFKEKLDGIILKADVSIVFNKSQFFVTCFGSVDDECAFFFRNVQLHLMSSNL